MDFRQRIIKAKEDLEALQFHLGEIRKLCNKYTHLTPGTEKADRFKQEWPTWKTHFQAVVNLYSNDPHNALLILRNAGLLERKHRWFFHIPRPWLDCLRDLYGDEGPETLKMQVNGNYLFVELVHPASSLAVLIESLNNLAIFATHAPSFTKFIELVSDTLRKGIMFLENVIQNPEKLEALEKQLFGGGGRNQDLSPGHYNSLKEQIQKIEDRTKNIFTMVSPTNPIITKDTTGQYYFAGKPISLTQEPLQLFKFAFDRRGAWIEIPGRIFNENERANINRIREALKHAGDPDPKATFETRRRTKSVSIAYRIKEERLRSS